jgi:hypothetical protein
VKLALVALALAAAPLAQAAPGTFSTDGLTGWQAQAFRGRHETQYRLVDDHGTRVLQADCNAGASGLIWAGPIDLKSTPRLSWRWRAQSLLPVKDERSKEGDDFVLRVYVVHHGGLAFWRTRTLVYVWSSANPAGGDWPSAYTANAHVIALRGGSQGLGEWQPESRDVRRDFHDFLGLDLDVADAVAVMSDCDDSGAAARAWYGDFHFDAAR